jgi:hypothetical protein
LSLWHEARASSGGFANFANFRMRAALYACELKLRVLDSIVVK